MLWLLLPGMSAATLALVAWKRPGMLVAQPAFFVLNCVVLPIGLLALIHWLRLRACPTRPEEFRASVENVAHPGLRGVLKELASRTRRLPKPKVVAAALAAGPADEAGRAYVVHGYHCEPPQPDEYRFEPRLLAPPSSYAALVDNFMRLGVIVAVFLVMSAVTGKLETWTSIRPRDAVLIGALVLGGFLWHAARTWLVPRYVRISPGLIEIIRYPTFARRPRIEAYPITAGTAVVVMGSGQRITDLYLHRNGRGVHLSKQLEHDPEATSEVVWRALVSTAEAPRLPQDVLTG